MFFLGFAIGLTVGACLGVIIMALFQINRTNNHTK